MGRNLMDSVAKAIDWAAADIHAEPPTRAWAGSSLLWVWTGKDSRSAWQASVEATEDEPEFSARIGTRCSAWLKDRSATWAASPWADTVSLSAFDDSTAEKQLVRFLVLKINQAIEVAGRKAATLEPNPSRAAELWSGPRPH